MKTYKLYVRESQQTADAVVTINAESQISFIFAPDNTYYRNFKKEINEEKAQLQDADGNVMTAEEAKAYIATLP